MAVQKTFYSLKLVKNFLDLQKELSRYKNAKRAKIRQRFFKTGKGEYAEGDKFLGLTVPQIRTIAKKYSYLTLSDIRKLLTSKIHEERQAALFILVDKFQKGENEIKKEIFDLYCNLAHCVNNWDLVDCSAHKIVGAYLWHDSDRKLLTSFAKDKNLWRRRISIIATFYFVQQSSFDDALKIAEIMLRDKHDLIHKATGWMLREVAKRDFNLAENFLAKHCKIMPRTMLRYAIEKFPEDKRKKYLNGSV